MSPDEIRFGLDRYLTRAYDDPKQFAINFRNSLIFLVPYDLPNNMVPLAWAISATKDGWENTTRSMNSGNARTRAEAAGLERIESDHPLHEKFWEIAHEKALTLTRQHLSERQLGFSRHHSHPRSAQENSFYLLSRNIPEALDPMSLDNLPENEGAGRQITTNRYERKSKLRNACIAHHRSLNGGSIKCASCGFDFEVVYGPVGSGFIHIHHIDPLGNKQEEALVDPIRDLVPLCPNCHAMAHRGLRDGEMPRLADELEAIRKRNAT